MDVSLFSVSDGFARRETSITFQPFEVNSDSSGGELGQKAHYEKIFLRFVSLSWSMIAMKYKFWDLHSIRFHFSMLSELLYLSAAVASSQLISPCIHDTVLLSYLATSTGLSHNIYSLFLDQECDFEGDLSVTLTYCALVCTLERSQKA